ncbi:MAG: monooxygenase [Myxococcota bacterium]
MRLVSLLFIAAALLGCQAAGPTYAQDVKPMLDGRCVNCHTTGGIAPFKLDTYADAKLHAAAIVDAVQAGRMPPWRAGPADVTYLRNPSLSDEQKAALAAWAKNGAPEGDSSKPGQPLPPVGGGMERVDLSLEMAEAYTPMVRPDDYRCFVLRWPKTAPTYVTGVNTIPGVPAQVHHLALYLVPPDSAHLPAQWDAEDATPGYQCFGGPFGSRPQEFAVNLLTAWIPGYQGTTFPRGGGVLVEPGATIVMQLHYNLDNVPTAQADRTAVDFQLADTVSRRFAYQPMLDVAWVAGQMKIPANAPDVTHQYVADPRSFFKLLGSPLDTANGFNLEAVMFHMHQLGKRGELWLEKADRRRIKVLDIPNWDFHWQNEYQLAEPVRFEPGDQLRVKCTFDNSPGRAGPGVASMDTNWGENSTEEMCVANILSSE